MNSLKLFTDGAANYQTGEGGVAFMIKDHENKVKCLYSRHIDDITSNRAEYLAVILGLLYCHSLNADEVDVYTDSELIIRQMSGYYSVRSNRDLYEALKETAELFRKVRFHHVRSENNPVHHLADQAYRNRHEIDHRITEEQ